MFSDDFPGCQSIIILDSQKHIITLTRVHKTNVWMRIIGNILIKYIATGYHYERKRTARSNLVPN